MSIAGFFTGRDRYVRRRRSRGRGRRRPGRGGGDGPGPDPGLASAFLWADLDGSGAGVASFGGAGTNQYYLTGSPLIPTGKSAYTVHVLFRAAAIGSILSLFDQRPLDGGTALTAARLSVLASGAIRAVIRDGTNAAIVADASGAVSAGAWTLATLVRDGANLAVYRDAGAKATASGTMIATPGGVNAIGGFRSAWPAADLMHGEIMFVDVLDGAQSDAEVAAYHAALGTLGSSWPGVDAARINRLDFTAPVVRGATDQSVVARAFGVPSFVAAGAEPDELHDPYPGVPVLRLGGWAFAPDSAPTYQHTPARLVPGGVMSGSRSGAVLLAAGAGSADVGLQLAPGPPAAAEQLYAEILPDGSGITVARTAGDFVEVKLLAAGGSVGGTLTTADTLYGRAAIATSSATNLDAWFSGAVSSTPLTRLELGLDGGLADCLKFGEGHKVAIEGDANYAGEYAIAAVDPVAGWVRIVVDGHDAPAISASGTHLRSAGEVEHTPSSGDAPRYAGLRVHVEGDAVEVYSLGRLIGSGTLAGLSSLGASGATRYLGTHPGSPDDAPTSAIAGVAEGSGLDADGLAELDQRLAFLSHRRDGWAADHVAAWVGDAPGTWFPSYIEEEREVAILEPGGAALVGDGWEHAETGQGYGRSNGVGVIRDAGADDLAGAATYPVRLVLCRRAFGYSDEALTPEVLYSGPVAELRRRPLDWKWRKVYIDPTLGSDSNPGTEASPWATVAPLLKSWGPYTAAYFKRGETHSSMGGFSGSGYVYPSNDLGFACQGPVRFETYGDAGQRATLGFANATALRLGGFGFRVGPGFRFTKIVNFNQSQDHAYVDCLCDSASDHLRSTRARAVLLDLYESTGGPTAYQIFGDGDNNWLLGIVRPLFGAGVADGSHVLRLQGGVGVEFALMRTREGALTGDGSTKNFEFRHGFKGLVATDIIDDTRKFASSADADRNAVHANVRYESCSVANVDVIQCSGAIVGHFLQSSTVGTPNATALTGPEHKVGARRMRALGTRTRTGGSGAWSRFTHEPASGAFANADDADGDFGAVSMPGVALAEAAPDGAVTLLADGLPLGGPASLVALRWRRRPSAGSTWTAVDGSGRRISSDPAPGPGTYVYSTYCGDDPDSPDAAGAESDSVAVA